MLNYELILFDNFYNYQFNQGNMQPRSRFLRNQKPQSTWNKGVLAPDARKGDGNAVELVQTADLSKMDAPEESKPAKKALFEDADLSKN